MATTVTLGGITFNATDGNNVTWRVRDVAGWDSPGRRVAAFEPASRHGAKFGENLYGPRRLTFERGRISAPSNSALWTARNDLAAAVDLVSAGGTLVVNEPTPKQMTVWLADRDRPLRVREVSDKVVEFELDLIADDPFKYATSTTSINITGSGALTNDGNFRTSNISLTIPAGATVTNTTDASKAIVTTGSGTLTVDVLNRTATKGGVNAYDQIDPATAWWALLPGSNTITVSSGTLTGSFRSAWL